MHKACTGVLSYTDIKPAASVKVIGLHYSSQNLSYCISTVNPAFGAEKMGYTVLSGG